MKDENGHIDKEALQAAARLFGSQVQDVETGLESIRLKNRSVEREGWFYRLPLRTTEAEAVYRFDDSRPAVTECKLGNGRAVRIGTNFFQAYFTRPDKEAGKWLASLLPQTLHDSIALVNSRKDLRLRQLDHPQGKLLILLNYDSAAVFAEIRFESSGVLLHLNNGEPQPVQAGETVRLQVDARNTAQYFFENRCARK
ncbi:hypothetical protein O9H85_18115 [Paenibacillus filicis]|uniref:Uncharacterized protein n=1 Tax=Paenibacillus gyeongsangnamensis TaxID=3388067 RepID=A0ABT4QBP6_9BACL|nr:hypothetical protein [Paenibacillus filicis]MCZ8514308.1 hypothetical protein [Paenibacillus filicis]